jgi:hypothetical protein
MLDDLRNSAAKSFQEEEEEKEKENTVAQTHEVIRLRKQRESAPFLGMTAQQRFVVALLLFMMVSVMGVLLLVATEKIFLF